MMPDEETVTVNKKALMEVFLEMERQVSLEQFYLFQCLDQVEQAYLDIYKLVEGCYVCPAKNKVLDLLFPAKDEFTISDAVLEEWQAAFEVRLRREKEQQQRKRPRVVIHEYFSNAL